jgi:hypothetical protein
MGTRKSFREVKWPGLELTIRLRAVLETGILLLKTAESYSGL